MKSEVIVTDGELPQDVLRAIQDGRKFEAIKLLREATGLGLANAKVLVDRAARHQPAKAAHAALGESDRGFPRLLKSLLVAILLFAVYRYFSQA
jgi:hypothetical protein